MLSNDDIQAHVLAVFRAEQAEHRQTIADILLDLERASEQSPQREQIDRLFRAAHSLKGGARAAGVHAVEQIAHQIEHVFAALRQQRLQLTADICDVIYQALDVIGALMEQATPGVVTDEAAFRALLSRLAAIAQTDADQPPSEPTPHVARPAAAPAGAGPSETTVRVDVDVLDHLMHEVGELLTSTLRARQLARDLQALAPQFERWRRAWRRAAPMVRRAQRRPAPSPGGKTDGDDLQALASVLVLANEVIDTLSTSLGRLTALAREDHDRLSAISARLQTHVQRTRMAPLSGIVGPLRLHARELARSAGKEVEFIIDDGGAEADRQVLEQVRDICLHLLRNAIDHGIEPPETRQARGKSATGLIKLTARASGDRLLLTVSDDGAGIDLERVRQQALAGGLLTHDAGPVDHATLLDLIFLPGFSTKGSVSALSGRGVGLDVVRTTVERMGGQVSVATTPGQGTTFTLSLPLTLQRSHGLLIQIAGHTFALPLDSLQRIVSAGRDRVRMLEGRAVLLVEGRPLPLIPLDQLLGMSDGSAVTLDAPRPALLLGNDRQIACLVDAISEELELVVHRLPPPLQRVRFVSGAAILADGSVAPILDPVDLVRAAVTTRHTLRLPDATTSQRQAPTILVVDDSITTRTLEKNILEAAGYRVALATNGQEALEQLRALQAQGGCQLVLSDVDMPRLNGFELTERIRSDPHLRQLPVVLVTSLDSPTDRERGLAAGADAYIVKRAFDQQALLATIARLL